MTTSLKTQPWRAMVSEVAAVLGMGEDAAGRLQVTGEGSLPSCYPVSDLATASIGAACLAVSDLIGAGAVTVDRRLASRWFDWSIRPLGWETPPVWDPIAGDYPTRDGWIRLHTNAPHHRRAALSVLDGEPTRDAVAAAVKSWDGDALESAVVAAGGCAAVMRSEDAWRRHPQGQAVASEPLITIEPLSGRRTNGSAHSARPLAGVRVLDLTRILAGPVATRFLAGYGADVLRIDPPGWDEPVVAPEVMLGKRSARLDLRVTEDRAVFERLLADADVLVHGYRTGALDDLSYGPAQLQAIRPGLIDVSLNAYGQTGPWSGRRGFDSLLQMSCGIAAAGMAWQDVGKPHPLPVQALDHATGYLMAATVVRALHDRRDHGAGWRARLSLARTARLLTDHRGAPTIEGLPNRDGDWNDAIEHTAWGPAHRLCPPAWVEGAPMSWDRPATLLGSALPQWI